MFTHFAPALAIADVLDDGKDVGSEVTLEHWRKLFDDRAEQ